MVNFYWLLPTAAAVLLLLYVLYLWRKNKRLSESAAQLRKRISERSEEIASTDEELRAANERLTDQARELERLNSMKTQFFHNISHELRTPLTLIKGPAARLLKQNNLPPESKNHLARIYRNTRRLSQLVEQILDLNRIESGSLTLTVRHIDFTSYLRLLTESYTSLMDSKGLSFELELPEDSVHLYIDLDKIEKVISNLLNNAAKFTPENGTVSVTMEEHDDHVSIRVSDSGIGISEDQLERIFSRFETRGTEDVSFRQGLGIGLSLSQEYLKLHKGWFEVESEPNRGTTFTLNLKKGKAHFREKDILEDRYEIESMFNREPVVVEREVQKYPTNGYQILLIEDNQELSGYISSSLAEHGYHVITAENGKKGLELAREEHPDVIVSDIMMPVMNGFELIEALRKDNHLKLTPTIFLTALSNIKDRLRSLQIGVNDYIVKPFDNDELLIRIKNLIEFDEMRRKRQQEVAEQEAEEGYEDIDTAAYGDGEFTQKLVHWIRAQVESNELTTESMAKAMAMSRSTLYRAIKKHTGFTAAGLLREVRLQKAREIAEAGETTSIADLSKRVGFGNGTYFRDLYIHRFGKDPFDE